jgi:glyoxylase-like metal-dependent hydrolase (beta-lactamase superfamily II)
MKLARPLLAGLLAAAFAGAQSELSTDPDLHILPVQGNVYMLVGAGGNIAMSIGGDGILLVDSGREEMANRVLKAALDLSTRVTASAAPNQCSGLRCSRSPYGWSSPSLNARISSPARPKPIRYIINTSIDADHTGGNAKLAELPKDSKILGVTFPPVGVAPTANVISHENVLKRMSEQKGNDTAVPSSMWPTETFHIAKYKLSEFFNGEGIQVMYQPNAHTDGDSMVYFRYSDVIVAGDILNPTSYPAIDIEKGGSYQGVLAGLNFILDLAIPEFRSQGGTMVIPGHGRLMDTGDVANYRNMVQVIGDRVQAMISKGATLEQVKAAKITLDYDGIYGSPDAFLEATYKSLTKGAAK